MFNNTEAVMNPQSISYWQWSLGKYLSSKHLFLSLSILRLQATNFTHTTCLYLKFKKVLYFFINCALSGANKVPTDVACGAPTGVTSLPPPQKKREDY